MNFLLYAWVDEQGPQEQGYKRIMNNSSTVGLISLNL